MRLRKLEKKDASLMLGWMHSPSAVKNLQADFAHKKLYDCENFIAHSEADEQNLHLTIVDDDDTYTGTVSLKNIKDSEDELAITIRECAMGKGYSKYGMAEILRMGLEELNLKRIYWCVALEDKRAVKFYDKNGYERTNIDESKIQGRHEIVNPSLHLVSKKLKGHVRRQQRKTPHNLICLIPAFGMQNV